jgi:hypothetical protein
VLALTVLQDHPDRAHLLRNSVIKMVIVILAIAGAIALCV